MTTNNNLVTPNNQQIDKLKIIQLNTSNADWDSKSVELLTTIDENKADICIISEANAEIYKTDKMTNRLRIFKNFNIEDKAICNQQKARVSIVISKKIRYVRCQHLENDNNSTIILKIKETKHKDIFLVGSYRE